MAEQIDVKAELKAATDRVLASKSRKKLVVAGPGAGKTYLFRELLKSATGSTEQRLVLTFINTLKDDLERNLEDASRVFTLHGYCQYILRHNESLRSGLSAQFRCYPGLRRLIPQDWVFIHESDPPHFVDLMRNLNCTDEQTSFYLDRANYYDAVDFDDSVYRAYRQLAANTTRVPAYTLVLIDEFQDFNKMEASIIDLLAQRSPIVIAGDDDQALYSLLRSASWDHIRAHYANGEYDIFELPFCMRCPEVIVGAVNDIIARAHAGQKLNGRIPKPYRYYEPIKAEDSAKYPHIELVETTVQRGNANYFGRYIEECIRSISPAEVTEAAEKNEPVALIICSDPYRRQIEEHLTKVGLIAAKQTVQRPEREKGLQILSEEGESNLGWRIILACGRGYVARSLIRKAFEEGRPLIELFTPTERDPILAEAEAWAQENEATDFTDEAHEATEGVAVTSYEGSKGRSAQYVFLVGVHSGELPSNAANIKDIEICRFLVGLTRTKKKCSILVTKNAMGQVKNRSEFITWINAKRYREKKVGAEYWKK
jgi:ATP-dependent DNA helicase UvrD/PcrA